MDKNTSNKKVHPWQQEPIIRQIKCSNVDAIWSMVMPVYNQEKQLRNVLAKIMLNAKLPFNLILIDDASNDCTLNVINSFASEIIAKHAEKISEIVIVQNPVPIYETACDNQGFRISNTEYIIEIQSDIHVEEYGFDEKMINALDNLQLGAISGRHVHNFSMLEGRRAWLKYPLKKLCWRLSKWGCSEGEGRLGKKIFERIENVENACFIGETVARGPWLIKKSDLINLCYLDEENFFLGNDDHDYHRRLYQLLGKSVGYLPMDIYSILEDGATRKSRIGINKDVFEFLKLNKCGSVEFNHFMKRYRPFRVISKHSL